MVSLFITSNVHPLFLKCALNVQPKFVQQAMILQIALAERQSVLVSPEGEVPLDSAECETV